MPTIIPPTYQPVVHPMLSPMNDCKIYVGNVSYDLTEQDIKKTFDGFGTIKNVSLSKDTTLGRHKGFGFVEYTTGEAAQLALQSMNGFPLCGRNLKVGRPHFAGTLSTAISISPPIPTLNSLPFKVLVSNIDQNYNQTDLVTIFSMFGTIKSCTLPSDSSQTVHKGYGFIEFASAAQMNEAIVKLNGHELGSKKLSVMPATHNPIIPPAKEQDKKSSCIVLRNVGFDKDDDDDTIKMDIKQECEKSGKVLLVEIQKQNDQMNVFVYFDHPNSADKARIALDKRWFGGKIVTAEFVSAAEVK
ncbi:poly(U)-binding-splicing factor PUF60 [Acrasis kona]|uniref:Poly(U)-binding-splicing factor PUF60 n=1 Tax=Acrasis kona TaxID=1008807 RepID=A0AAW2YL97_9EUKA